MLAEYVVTTLSLSHSEASLSSGAEFNRNQFSPPTSTLQRILYKHTTNTIYATNLVVPSSRVAEVGWLSVSATKSLRAFVERVFANFCDKNIVFYD